MRAVAVGDAVTELVRMIELPDMVAYAGATWDWHRMHYDTAYLTEHGFQAPVVDGQVFGALLAETVQDWMGPTALLRSLNFRFANLVYAGETVRCGGTVVEADGRSVTVTLSVDVVGVDARPAVASAGAVLVEWP